MGSSQRMTKDILMLHPTIALALVDELVEDAIRAHSGKGRGGRRM